MTQSNHVVSEEANFYFFFFINTKSGYGQGKQYLSHNFKEIKYKYQSKRSAFIFLCDLFVNEDKTKLLNKIKQLEEKCQKNIRVIISGGDGTILWVVNEIISTGINPNNLVFGINPIGTGNDFSRSLGWGFEPLIKTGLSFRQQLGKQILTWMNSEVGKYDLWDVDLQTYPNGQIYDIKNQIEIRRDETKISKTFSNYVGMGLDARVVYTVQRKRTSNAFINKIIYGCVGFCNFFRSLKKLDTLSFASETSTQFSQKFNNTPYLKSKETDISLVQTDVTDIEQMITNSNTMNLSKQDSDNYETIYKLKKGYRGIVCLNCPSYMCGLKHVWRTNKIAEQTSQACHFRQQKFDDGQVEFIAYKNQLDLALQRIMRSGAKLAQGGGAFRLLMQKTQKPSEIDNFIQIDGQSIKVTHLKQIRIQKTNKIQGSQLNVMWNVKKSEEK